MNYSRVNSEIYYFYYYTINVVFCQAKIFENIANPLLCVEYVKTSERE